MNPFRIDVENDSFSPVASKRTQTLRDSELYADSSLIMVNAPCAFLFFVEYIILIDPLFSLYSLSLLHENRIIS